MGSPSTTDRNAMRQVLLIIDVQPSFNPPAWLVDGINSLLGRMPSVATVERHDESVTPFARQLGWQPAPPACRSPPA